MPLVDCSRMKLDSEVLRMSIPDATTYLNQVEAWSNDVNSTHTVPPPWAQLHLKRVARLRSRMGI
jgi:hypothetical protein